MKIGYCDPVAFNALLLLRREHRIGWRAFGLGMVIASFADKGTSEAWPSRATLSALTGIEETDISRVVRELANAGFLSIGFREGHSNIYRLTHGDLATGGKLPPSGKQPPTHGCLASKPVGVQPPITIKEQPRNNDLSQNDEKPPSSSAPETTSLNPGSESKPKGKSSTQGNQTTSPLPPSSARRPRPAVAMGDDGFVVPDAIRRGWATAYPGVDIDREAAKAFAWCQSNPRRAPKKDYSRFLNGWMGRAKPSGFMTAAEQAADDAELIRGAEDAFPDPDERAAFFWARKERGLRVPPGVDCRPMPVEKEVVA